MAPLPDYASRRFMIVDDEAFMLGQLERLLKLGKPGVIVKASDGGSALRVMRDESGHFDCIITDFDMRPINGLQLLSAIRLGVNPRIPRSQRLILLTGNSDMTVMDAARALDVNGFLAKPVKPDTLFPIIDQVLNSREHIQSVEAYRAIKLPISSLA